MATTQLVSSDFNLQRLDTKKLASHLDYSIAAGTNMVIIGRRGSGKSIISKQRIDTSGYKELYVNLSVFERPDLAGFPRVFLSSNKEDMKQKFIDYMMPRMYESLMAGDQKVVILFDEADKCDSSIWAALLEILQFHSINGTQFPNLQSCILTGNLIAEGGNKIHPPLIDRAEAYLLETDAINWLDWAGASGEIHPSVFQYIQDHPHMLFGKVDLGDDFKDPSPRAWHLASNIIRFGEDNGFHTDLILEKIGGFVGKAAAVDFFAYYTHYQVLLPFVNSVFAGDDVKKQYQAMSPSDKLTACMIVSSRFASKLDECDPDKDKPECLETLATFISYVEPENFLASFRAQVQYERMKKWSLQRHPAWKVLIKSLLIEIGNG